MSNAQIQHSRAAHQGSTQQPPILEGLLLHERCRLFFLRKDGTLYSIDHFPERLSQHSISTLLSEKVAVEKKQLFSMELLKNRMNRNPVKETVVMRENRISL
jgi:hypothetical protein